MKTRNLVVVLALALVLAGCNTPGEKSPLKQAVAAKEWHSLAIGQTLALDEDSTVWRVPGGWVFQTVGGWGISAVCFIPYSDEGAEK